MSELHDIWRVIVTASENAQIIEGENKGCVINPVLNCVYMRETAFAAKIFATEWLRTGSDEYKSRAFIALDSIQDLLCENILSEGLNEPFYTPRGVKYRKGSIPATILMLYAAFDAAETANYPLDFNVEVVSKYLRQCYVGKGRFLHDIQKGRKLEASEKVVVNTTAMAYFFLKNVLDEVASGIDLKEIENCIATSQRSDGFWPYIAPSSFQHLIFNISRFIPKKVISVYDRVLGDNSIFFGDALHNVIVPYYYLLAHKAGDFLPNRDVELMRKGYEFILNKTYKSGHGSIGIDFSWEPKPRFYRHCNFLDTSTYFYLLDLLNLLHDHQIIGKKELLEESSGLISHIASHLLNEEAYNIAPYEGDQSVIEKILPRPAESIFDKGFLFSRVVLKHSEVF